MKKILMGLGIILLLFIIYAVYALFIATPASPPDTVEYSNNGLEITVDYSRPYKKGRLIFGDEADGALQPFGKYWRLGANAATEITVNQDVLFGGNPLNAGTYRMYAIPGAKAFKVIINSETGVFFGAVEPDPELDLFTVDAPVTMQDQVTEQFTISIKDAPQGADIEFVWDQFKFTIPVTSQ